MKYLQAVVVCLLCGVSLAFSQERPPEPTQNPEAAFRLYATTNIYTLLKLDTRDGRIWQVQWGDPSHRFTTPLSLEPLVVGGKPGRLTLYPTKNIYTFVLLDQETGDTWHVQWSNSIAERFVRSIRDMAEVLKD